MHRYWLNLDITLEGKELRIYVTKDGLGWTPLMMAASLKDGDDIVDLLLRKGADVNMTSTSLSSHLGPHYIADDTQTTTARYDIP